MYLSIDNRSSATFAAEKGALREIFRGGSGRKKKKVGGGGSERTVANEHKPPSRSSNSMLIGCDAFRG